ncbi:MAG: hypothetical protein V3T72_04195 [Thermoanaerobaculia bacterium]
MGRSIKGDLFSDLQSLSQLQGAAFDPCPQIVTLHERHHQEERLLVAAKVVDRDDPRMVQLCQRPRFAPKPLLGVGVQAAGGDGLDRHLAVEELVVGPVDDTHPTASELVAELVAPAQADAGGELHRRRIIRCRVPPLVRVHGRHSNLLQLLSVFHSANAEETARRCSRF